MRKAVCWLEPILIAPSTSCLQDVLRNWYARLPVVVQNARRLVRQTEKCAEAFHQGELLIHSEVNRVKGLTQLHILGPRGSCFLLVRALSQFKTCLMGMAL